MSKCIRCRENEGIYPHYNGGKVCGECLDYYFQFMFIANQICYNNCIS